MSMIKNDKIFEITHLLVVEVYHTPPNFPEAVPSVDSICK